MELTSNMMIAQDYYSHEELYGTHMTQLMKYTSCMVILIVESKRLSWLHYTYAHWSSSRSYPTLTKVSLVLRYAYSTSAWVSKLNCPKQRCLSCANNMRDWKRHIHQHLNHSDPDVIICAQMEDVALLPSRTESQYPCHRRSVCTRLLENLYETDDGEVSHQLLRAIDRADAYLAST